MVCQMGARHCWVSTSQTSQTSTWAAIAAAILFFLSRLGFVVPVVARKSDFCAVTTLVQLRQQLRANLDPYTALASFPRFVQVAGMSQAEATAVLCISRLPGIGKTLSNWPKTTTFLLSCATHFAGVRACWSPRKWSPHL